MFFIKNPLSWSIAIRKCSILVVFISISKNYSINVQSIFDENHKISVNAVAYFFAAANE